METTIATSRGEHSYTVSGPPIRPTRWSTPTPERPEGALEPGLIYLILTDAVLVTHGLFVLFVVLGALLALRWPWILWLHAPAALWGAWVELAGHICPLTPLENHLRRLAGAAAYEGGFIERYVTRLVYPEGLTREVQIALGLLVLVANGVLYIAVLRRMRGPGAEE